MIDEKKLLEDLKGKDIENYIIDGGTVTDTYDNSTIVDIINEQPKVGEWIPCNLRLPEEHDSIFARFKGTNKWNNNMYEKVSDDVNVTIECDDGSRNTKTMYTHDGKWYSNSVVWGKVIAWKPLPTPYQGGDTIAQD